MKQLFYALIVFSFFTPAFTAHAQDENPDQTLLTHNDNAITIEIVAKGSYVLWDYVLNAEKITATKHQTNGNVPITVFEKVFTPEEKIEVEKFINNFPAEPLKEQYVNPNVKGEGSYWFNFRINTLRKKVVVSYEYPAELKTVVDFFNARLHEKYRIGFE